MLLRVIYLALIFCLLSVSFANAELYMTVSGRVVDETTNTGIAGVEITAFKPRDKDTKFLNVKTDKDGVFVLRDVTSGEYQLNVSSAYTYVRTVTVLTVPKGKNVNNVSIPLKKSGFMSGKVMRADGTPVEKALVIAASLEGYKSTATTKPDGTYAMRDLIPGSYKVYAMAENVNREFITGIDVTEGQMTGNVDFVLGALDQGIEGVVTDLAGNPIKEAVVFVIANGSQALGVTDASGHYKVQGLLAGSYKLTIFAPGYDGAVREDVHVGGNAWTTVNIILQKQLESRMFGRNSLVAGMNGIGTVETSEQSSIILDIPSLNGNLLLNLSRILVSTTLIAAQTYPNDHPWHREHYVHEWDGELFYVSAGDVGGVSVFFIQSLRVNSPPLAAYKVCFCFSCGVECMYERIHPQEP